MSQSFIEKYFASLESIIAQLDPQAFEKTIAILTEAYLQDRQIFIAGNGGSAASANHFVCDFGKNAIQREEARRFRIISLCDNVEKITAIANDIAFEQIFSFQLENLMRPGDVLILISASGSSPNILEALTCARQVEGSSVITLSGFEGGKIAGLADASLVARSESYERVEDIHLIILHMIVCYFKEHPELTMPKGETHSL